MDDLHNLPFQNIFELLKSFLCTSKYRPISIIVACELEELGKFDQLVINNQNFGICL